MAVLTDSFTYDICLICASSLFVLYGLLSYLRNKWTRRGIPCWNVHPLMGNLQDVFFGRKITNDVFKDFYLQHKSKPYIGFFSLIQPSVMINDLELIKSVLIKDFSSFTDRNFEATTKDPLQYHAIFASKGQTWRNLRTNLSPTFTSGKMKKMFELVNVCGKALAACIEREIAGSGNMPTRDVFARYTIDVISTCGFGIDGNALKDANSSFGQKMKQATALDFKQIIVGTTMFLFPSAAKLINISFTKPDIENFFRNTVWDTVEQRKKKKITRNDFLDLLLQLKNKGRLDTDEPLEDGEVLEKSSTKLDLEGDKFVAQCFTFLVAGYETSSSTMANAMYELAMNPDVQQKTYEEITSVLSKYDGKLTYETVQDMTYLHMVVQETLRKYPVLTFLDRKATRPYRLPGSAIELAPGESVLIPVIGLHYDPDFYPQPERFDPERFNEENRVTRPACTFLGFGDGPRICIGMRLGLMQVKVGLIYSLLNYEFSPNKETPKSLQFSNIAPFSQVKGTIPLGLKKRSV